MVFTLNNDLKLKRGKKASHKKVARAGTERLTFKPSRRCMPFQHVWNGVKLAFREMLGRPHPLSPIASRLMEGTTIANRYVIRNEIGSGGFGRVYAAIDLDTGRRVAVKAMPGKKGLLSLRKERRVYRALRKSERFKGKGTRVYYLGQLGGTYVMVMDRHGASLGGLVEERGAMRGKDVMRIGLQAIDLLENLHEQGYVHRDIKPENMMMELDGETTVHLIDFGLSEKFREEDGSHVRNGGRKSFTGTVYFSSGHADEGNKVMRRDDMESLMYVMAYLRRGCLPWSLMGVKGEYGANTRRFLQDVWRVKRKTSLEHLCKDMPGEFLEVFQYTKAMEFEEKPHYEWMREMFRKGLGRVLAEERLAQAEADLKEGVPQVEKKAGKNGKKWTKSW